MLHAYSLDQVRQDLSNAFASRYSVQEDNQVKMVGLLFAPFGSKISKEEIVPRLNDFHHRSGNNIDFFCAGYGAYWGPEYALDEEAVITLRDQWGSPIEWKYSSERFHVFLKEVKAAAPKWSYSNEVDLLLLNAYPDPETGAKLDFSTVIALMLSRAKADGVINSAAELLGHVFNYVEEGVRKDPTRGFSDAMGFREIAFWGLSSIPDFLRTFRSPKLGQLWTRGRHYAVLNLTEDDQPPGDIHQWMP